MTDDQIYDMIPGLHEGILTAQNRAEQDRKTAAVYDKWRAENPGKTPEYLKDIAPLLL